MQGERLHFRAIDPDDDDDDDDYEENDSSSSSNDHTSRKAIPSSEDDQQKDDEREKALEPEEHSLSTGDDVLVRKMMKDVSLEEVQYMQKSFDIVSHHQSNSPWYVQC